MTCGQFSLLGATGDEAAAYFLRCKSWRCKRCGPRKVKRTIAVIQAGMAAGFIRFATFTARGEEDADASFREATRRWKRLHLRIQRRWGKFEYFIVVEPQKRGHAHLHVLIRGPRFIPQRQLARIAAECGFGSVADIREGKAYLARYLAKYLSKTLELTQAQAGRYFRRVRMSRHWVEKTTWEPDHRWERWWILDVPPVLAGFEAHRRGYHVVHFDTDGHEPPTMLGRIVQWLHTLAGYRSAGFWSPPGSPSKLPEPVADLSGSLRPTGEFSGIQPAAATDRAQPQP